MHEYIKYNNHLNQHKHLTQCLKTKRIISLVTLNILHCCGLRNDGIIQPVSPVF